MKRNFIVFLMLMAVMPCQLFGQNSAPEQEQDQHKNENAEPLIRLNGFRTTDGVNLQWICESPDKKFKYFVESGINGEQFIGNTIIEGAKQKTFEYIDRTSGNGTRHYRVRVERDGNIIATSETILVTGVEEKPFSIYPNPTEGDVFTDLFQDFKGQGMRVIVKDQDGNVVVSKALTIEDKLNKLRILSGRDGLKPGTYKVSLAFKNKTFSDTITVK
ncbi:MAG: hypothetical protein ACU4F9_04850 [Arcticibacter sp.]